MLTFDVKQVAPTRAEIAAEKGRLQEREQRFLHKKYLGIGGGVALTAAGLIVGSLLVAGADTKTAVGLGFGALVGAVSAVLTGVGAAGGVLVTADTLVLAGVAIAVGATVGITDSAGAVAGVCAGTLLFAFVGLAYSVGLVVKKAAEVVGGCKNEMALLSFTDADKLQQRCPQIMEACRQDADCEAYRVAVAQTGRSLTVAETNMMRNRVAEAEARQFEEEQERQRQGACSILRSTE